MDNDQATDKSRRLIFISHATPQDNDFTAWLGARLASAGYEVWSDLTQLVGGEVFWKDIEEAIRKHSVKFLSVLSPVAPEKRGFMKELSVADAVEATAGLGDFIIPLRLKDIPFSELPIQIHNKNAIDFMCGWHLGLARLLEKLEKDGTPRRTGDVESSLTDWTKRFLHLGEGVEKEDEQVVSNWLAIESLPPTIRIMQFSLTPKSIADLKQQWPCRLVGWRLISFARADDFDIPLNASHPRDEVEIDTTTFLNSVIPQLGQLSYQDRANILTDLLRQGWELYAKGKGLHGFMLANNQLCWYFPKTQTKIEQVRFTDALGKKGRRALLGESKKLKAFWHLALEFSPSVGRQNRYTLLTHVVFTKDGQTPIGDPGHMHRLRRSFCKQWWQDRWRDLISAYLAELGQGQAVLSIGVAPGRAIALKAAPITYLSPIRTIEKEDPESAVEESMDDVDLLYDETDDFADDLDDEVDEAAE